MSQYFCRTCAGDQPLERRVTQKDGPNHGRPFLKCSKCDKFCSWEDQADTSPNVKKAGAQGRHAGQGPSPAGPPGYGQHAMASPLSGTKRPWQGNAYSDPNTPTRPRAGMDAAPGSSGSKAGGAGAWSLVGSSNPASLAQGQSQMMSPASQDGRLKVTVGTTQMHTRPNEPSSALCWRMFAQAKYDQDYVNLIKSLDWQQTHRSWLSDKKMWVFDTNAQAEVLKALLQAGYQVECLDGSIAVNSPQSDKPGWSIVLRLGGFHQPEDPTVFYVQAQGYRDAAKEALQEIGMGRLVKEDDLTYKTWFPETHAQHVITELRSRGFTLTCPDGSFDLGPDPAAQQRMDMQGDDDVTDLTQDEPEAGLVLSAEEEQQALQQIHSAVPRQLWDKLYEFQQEGVVFMVAKEGRALLADDMGLGKTVQALVTALAFAPGCWPLLVVCPPALRTVWRQAISTWVPDDLQPAEDDIWVIRSKADMNRHPVVPKRRPHVCITTYDLVQKMNGLEQKYRFIICDESHALKDRGTKRTKFVGQLVKAAAHAILITGTPIMSRPIEAWSQVDMLAPGLLGDYMTYGERYCLNTAGGGRQYGNEPDFRSAHHLKELHMRLTSHVMLRRLKSAVAQQLPDKITTRVPLLLDPPKAAVTAAMASLNACQAEADAAPGDQRLKEERQRLLNEAVHVVGRAKVPEAMEFVQSLLDKDQKVLLFGHHLDVLDACQDWLVQHDVPCTRLDGQTRDADRDVAVGRFQTDNAVRAMVLGITAAGAGLTLTAAQACVFVELVWNPSQLKQAEDRAHRFGQTEPVTCYYLTAEGTTDDIMWRSLQHKLRVVGDTLDGDGEGDGNPLSQRTRRQKQQQGSAGPSSGGAAAKRTRGGQAAIKAEPRDANDDDDEEEEAAEEEAVEEEAVEEVRREVRGRQKQTRHQEMANEQEEEDEEGGSRRQRRSATKSKASTGLRAKRAPRSLLHDLDAADGDGAAAASREGDPSQPSQPNQPDRSAGDGHGGSQSSQGSLARVRAAVAEVTQLALGSGGGAGGSQSSQSSQANPARMMTSMLEMVQSVLSAAKDSSIAKGEREGAIVKAVVETTMEQTMQYSQSQ